MATNDSSRGAPGWIAPVIAVGALCLLVLAGWSLLVELFAFGAPPGMPPSGNVHVASRGILGVDTLAPKLNDGLHVGSGFLEAETQKDEGPQAVWRTYITCWGFLMLGSAVLMLLVKRFVESENDETSVMHLKGDTDVAMRAKGDRG